MMKNIWPFADPLAINAQGEEKFMEEDSEPVTVAKEVEQGTSVKQLNSSITTPGKETKILLFVE